MNNTKFHLIGNGTIPIYRYDTPEHLLYYSPGYLAVLKNGQEQAELFEKQLFSSAKPKSVTAANLLQHASKAQQKMHAVHNAEFSPTCLTLYLNNECNLQCSYCFSNPSHQSQEKLSLSTIQAAASLVAENCRNQGIPLTVVFHGGGEPTLSWQLLQNALDIVEKVAAENHIPIFRYIATNGVMSQKKAEWVADHFDLIGLSCDGPPSIQANQRPLATGGESASFVEQSADLIHTRGKPLHVRVTITPETIYRQEEIAEYICKKIAPQEIHIEPVYNSKRAGSKIWEGKPEQVETFINAFIKARKIANEYGVKWVTSGSRLNDIHGPYCNIFRNVLNLVPGGAATPCFKFVSLSQLLEKSAMIGSMDAEKGQFILDHANIHRLKNSLSKSPEKCQTCVNYFHCIRSCPDDCSLIGAEADQNWRCQYLMKLTENDLIEMGAVLAQKVINQHDTAGSTIEQLESIVYGC